MAVEFKLMRSLIYVDVAKEDYRHRLKDWLCHYHVSDSISQFGPYVTKYAFYNALPTPPDGERFGTIRMQLTEHYWNVNPFSDEATIKAYTEYFPHNVLIWQGVAPEHLDESLPLMDGNDVRDRMVFVFVPVFWEKDLKGSERGIQDGPNYRWQFVVRYPDGVAIEEGDKWLFDEALAKFKEKKEVRRILTSKIMQEINGSKYHRVVEMWFDGPIAWHAAAVEATVDIAKPAWAQTDQFPYLEAGTGISSLFLTDTADSDNLTQHRGHIVMR
ncbi:acetyl-CoA hydrolase [Lachnospiraceae bacterium ZAX-1]